jgi:hypothetical protein
VVHLGADPTCADDCAVGPLSVHRQRGVCLWIHPGGLLLGEGANVAPEGASRGTRGTRAMLEAVVTDFGLPRRWQRGKLLYSRGSADMAADVAGYT